MIAREWKSGDVAILDYTHADGGLAIRVSACKDHGGSCRWHFASGSHAVGNGARTIRPLVVIDPEDRDAAFRLLSLWFGHVNATVSEVAKFQNCLREFANPTPPKPEEPTGLGAVVEDAEGERWVRVNVLTGTQEWRSCDFNGAFRKYAAINAVRILSEGVQ